MRNLLNFVISVGVLSILVPTFCNNDLLIPKACGFNFEEMVRGTVETTRRQTINDGDRAFTAAINISKENHGLQSVSKSYPADNHPVKQTRIALAPPRQVAASLVIDSMNITREQRRILLGLVMRKFPKEKENKEFLGAIIANEPDAIRNRYYNNYGWIGGNSFEKEDSQRTYVSERLESFLHSLPQLPLNYTNVTRVQISDYNERKGGFPIGNPRFGPELRLDRVLISPDLNWDIPELIPADRITGRRFLEKVDRYSDASTNKQLRWKPFYYATTVKLVDIVPRENRNRLFEYQLEVVPRTMNIYADQALTKLLHTFEVERGVEDQMQLAQAESAFSSLLNPPTGCDPISLPFINGYPTFGENLSKELYANHTKSSQQRTLDQKETAVKFQYKKNLGKYLDLLALADNVEALEVHNIEGSSRELATKRPEASPMLKKFQQSLYVRANFLTESRRKSFIQYFSDEYETVNFAGQSELEKQNNILGLHQSLSLQQLAEWGKNLPRRILYIAEVDLDEYDMNQGGFYLKNRYEDNGLCLRANCFFNSALTDTLLRPNNEHHPTPDFLPIGEEDARTLTSHLRQDNRSEFQKLYMAWTIDLLQQKIGAPVAFTPVSTDLYFDKQLTKQLYSFNLGQESSSESISTYQTDKTSGDQQAFFSSLQTPPRGIKAIELPIIQGIPSYMPIERDYTSSEDEYIWKHTVPGAFNNYLNLAILAANPDVFSFNQNDKDAVQRFWTDFLTDNEKKRFIQPQLRAGKIMYDDYTNQMLFEKHWLGTTPFDEIDTARIFYDQYKPVLTQWSKNVFSEPARIRLIQPVKISQYNFNTEEFAIQETGGSARDLLRSQYWSFTYQPLESWPASRQQASHANKKLVERAKTLYFQRNPQAKRFSIPNYFYAYRALTVELQPANDRLNGFGNVQSDGLYLDPQLAEKLADFTVENKKPVVFGEDSSKQRDAGPHRLNADTIHLFTFKERGLPADAASWDRVMEKRRFFERLHPEQCETLFFKPNSPTISEKHPAPAEIRQQFQQWIGSRIEDLESDTIFALMRKGPRKEQVNSEFTLFTLYDYPKAKKLQNPGEMTIKLKELNQGNYPKINIPAKNISLSVSPSTVRNLRPGAATEMRTQFRYIGMDGNNIILEPTSTQLLDQGGVLVEQTFSKQQIQNHRQAQQERKQYLIDKRINEGDLSYKEEKELESYCTPGELGILREAAIKASMKRSSQIYQKKADERKRKSQEKERTETLVKAISSAAGQIAKSRVCETWKRKSKKDSSLPPPETNKPVYFFWNETESPEFQFNQMVNWETSGKPSGSDDWFVIKSEISLPDCTEHEVHVFVQDYRRCEQPYCFEHSADIKYRPNEGELIFQ